MVEKRTPFLYLITDRSLCQQPPAEQLARALSLVEPSSVIVQLREKDLCARELFFLGKALLPVCQKYKVPLLINDRLDVALALGAQGVHLGGKSLSALQARKILGTHATIGVSVHGVSELRQRAPGADFATWGPVFPTASKQEYGPPVGFKELEEALLCGLPLVALGGIRQENAGQLRTKGFAGIACIKAVFCAANPAEAALSLWSAFRQAD